MRVQEETGLRAASGVLLDTYPPRHPAKPEPFEPTPFEGDARMRLARRVVESRYFARSPLLSRFLLYVVTETLEGRQAEITEHQIGVQVFARPSNYRTIEDNIVRNYARQLRKRLAEYFAAESGEDAMRIEIPIGGYIPVFRTKMGTEESAERDLSQPDIPPSEALQTGSAQMEQAAASLPAANAVTARNSAATVGATRLWLRAQRGVKAAIVIAYSLLLIALTWGVINWRRNAQAPEPARALWQTMLKGPENTYIVPPDAGFNLVEDISHQSVSLANYMHSTYSQLPLPQLDDHSIVDLRSQQLTDFVDVQIMVAISRLPDYDPQRVFLRFPRDLRLDDLKNSNAILIGSVCSNPWAALRDTQAEFSIVCSDGMQGSQILNRNPRKGEAISYASHWNEPTHATYALISFEPNLSGSGHLLLLEGLDVAGTQAAAEAVLQSDAIAPILKQARRIDGSIAPFEVLLRATSIQANATDAQVIASRIH